jgi:hypothetical protein
VRADEHYAPAVRDILQGERLKQRRATDASLQGKVGCHTFCARNHRLHRTADVITLNEVERNLICTSASGISARLPWFGTLLPEPDRYCIIVAFYG